MSSVRAHRWGVLLVLALAGGSARAASPPEQRDPWGRGDDAEIERALLEGEVIETRELGTGVTRPVKVHLRFGDRELDAVWKGVEQEYARTPTGSRRKDDLYFSDRWQHEVAAYRIDRLIGLHRVPPTVIRPLDGKPGAFQLWIDDAFTERDRVEQGIGLADPARFRQDRLLLQLFDALIYNVDRTQENMLISRRDGALTLIDHSRAFRLRPQLPARLRLDADRLPPGLVEGLNGLNAEVLDAAVGSLLTPGQRRAILERRDRLRKAWSRGD